jgi:hypothetical protein
MLIALLAVLGVDLIVILVLLVVVFTRRYWVRRQPGAFKGAIRVVKGDTPGLGAKWRRGDGRWVRDVLVWTKAPFLFRNQLVAVDGLAGERRLAKPGEVRRLGKQVSVEALVVDGGARIELATAADGSDLSLGPFAAPASETRAR